METTGKGVETTGKAVKVTGKTMQATGKGMQVAGKGMKIAGEGASTAGKAMTEAGAALSGTGIGALAGIPLAALGAGTTAAGAGMQAAGTGAETAGKGVETAGKGVEATGEGIEKTGQGIRNTGTQMKNIGNNMQNVSNMSKDRNNMVTPGIPAGISSNQNNNNILKNVLKTLKLLLIKFAIILTIIMLIAGFAWAILTQIADILSNTIDGLGNSYVAIDAQGNLEEGINITDEQIETLVQVIEQNGLTVEDLFLCGDIDYTKDEDDPENIKQRNKYLRQFLLAELCTQYPDFEIQEDETHYNGIIKIKRASENSDGTSSTDMTYVRKDIFDNIVTAINTGSKEGLDLGNYQNSSIAELRNIVTQIYSIDNNGNLYYATSNKVEVNGAETQFTVTTKSVNYKKTVEKYSMPMEVPLALCMASQNPEYVYQFIEDHVLTGEIVITIQETKRVDRYESWYDWSIRIGTRHVEHERDPITQEIISTNEYWTHENKEYNEQLDTITTITDIDATPQITSVDTWMAKETISYTNTQGKIEYPLGQETVVHNDVDYPGEFPENTSDHSYELNWCKFTETQKIVYNEWQRGTITVDTDEIERKANSIVSQWDETYRIPNTNRYEKPGENIVIDSQILIELLNKEATQKQAEIIKYLLRIYTKGEYYNDVTLDTSIYQEIDLESSVSISGADIIVDVTKSSSELVLNKAQLKTAIETRYSGNQRENLLSSLDAFYKIQTDNKVNSVFAVAVAICESSGGTNWGRISPTTYNWMSVTASSGYKDSHGTTWAVYSSFSDATKAFGNLIANGSRYFKSGNYTVKSIATAGYCVPPSPWDEHVLSTMKGIYSSVGISLDTLASEEMSGGYTGANSYGTSKYTYQEYKQGVGPWSTSKYASGTMASKGCCPTAVAIACSAKDSSVTPATIITTGRSENNLIYTESVLRRYWSYVSRIRSISSSSIASWLQNGDPIIIHVGSASSFTSNEHWMTLLGYSNGAVYVSNPNANGENGMVSISKLLTGAIEVIFLK